jgi:hypothetical protein
MEKDLGESPFHSCLLLEGSRSIYILKKREKKVTKIWLAPNHGDRLRIGDVSPPDLAIEESISAPP